MYMYGIPSFHRPECKCIDTLVKLGVDKSNICVSLQDESELDSYLIKHPDIHYFVRKTNCAAGNRNTLIKELEPPFVILDDDITSFVYKENRLSAFKKIEQVNELERLILLSENFARENGIPLLGCAATSNDLVARNRSKYSADVLLQGSFLVFIKKIQFDERWKMVEDYELSLRVIRYSNTLRDNYFCARKPKNGTNIGGLHERYANNELSYWITALGKKYSEFKPNKSLTGGCVKHG